jgi:hypothetical protein
MTGFDFGDLLDDLEAQAPSTSSNLPDEFWTARADLDLVRQAAWQRMRSPDAVLGATLARVATLTPPTTVLPAIVGDTATLDLLAGIIGAPGAGKSSAVAVARRLVPIVRTDVVDGLMLGSGEGLIDAYLGPVEEVEENGAKRRRRRQINTAVLAIVDEGQVLAELGGRRGATLLPTIRSAFFGATLGQANADVGRNRRVEAGRYRFAGVFAWQPEHAAAILADAPAGTPQRIVWFAGTDPAIPEEPPPWPGRLEWTPPPTITAGLELDVDEAAAGEIRSRALARARGNAVDVDPLDSHTDLCRLKIAALLAVLEDRVAVDAADWNLAGMVMASSDAVRSRIVAYHREQIRLREQAAIERAVRRSDAIADSTDRRAVAAAKRAVARRVHRDGAGSRVTRRELVLAIAGRDRELVSVDEVIAAAMAEGWIERDGDQYTPGRSRPA